MIFCDGSMDFMDVYAFLVLTLLQAAPSFCSTTPPPVPCTPTSIPNSSFLPNQTSFNDGETVTYTCETGYELTSGTLTLTCSTGGTWIETPPTCTIKTCAKEEVGNGTADPDQALYNYNTSVTYSCNLGFNHTSGDLVRTCNETASWTNALPVCTVVACIPETITYGSYDPADITTEFGATITYSCNLGYYMSAGDMNRTCLTNGGWTNTLPTCSLVRCDIPDPVQHSSYTPSLVVKFDFNTDITYSCDLSYNHTGGNLIRTCKEDFSWSGTAPNCTLANCIQEDSTYMTTTPNKVLHEFDEYVVYECIVGYNHSSGDLNRTCQLDGNWTGTTPECVIVTCDTTIPAHASIIPDVSEINYNTYITYACDLGYNHTDGDATRRCTENATFEGVEANCTLITCDPPDAISDGTYEPVLTSHDYNTTANFTCNLGYYLLSGNPIQRCDENANWVNEKPVCEIMKCPKPTEAYTTVSPNQVLYNFNTSVTSTCLTGYNMTDGDATRTCQHTGNWSGTPPNCTIVECAAPPPVSESSLSPNKNIYVYLDTLTYTCDTGYELTSGNDVRTCTETEEWSGSAPNCTIIHCPLPADGVRNTYSPALLDYVWNDTVVYTCDIGYNHSSGDLVSSCLHDKTWSGTTPVCIVITCDKIDVPYMTFNPPTADTHDFNTTIEYACVDGYNHSYGDLLRTCNYTREWTGTLPNCTIITCDPPDPIAHTFYVPNNLTEHDWNTSINYSCDPGYHYVSGENISTCNESGAFPPSDIDCSVQHEITISSSEPAVTWFNTTTNEISTVFDFDGMCDVTITCNPDLIDVSHVKSGNEIIMTVKQTASTQLDEYVCTLSPFRGERTFPDISRDVFFGDEILGFQAFLDHTMIYLAVGDTYNFFANATSGTNMSLDWQMEENITETQTYSGEFSIGYLAYAFTKPKHNISVIARNLVSSQTVEVAVEVFYKINNFKFSVENTLGNTTEPVEFDLYLMPVANLPMNDVNISINFKHGNFVTDDISIDEAYGVDKSHLYNHLFDMQGSFSVEARLTSILGFADYSIDMRIWDTLLPMELEFINGFGKYIITNTVAEFNFTNIPNYGFKYTIDYGDGTSESNVDDSILYNKYNLPLFTHVYTSPGVYILRWTAVNGEPIYNRAEHFAIHVQNKVPDTGYTHEPLGKKYPWSVLQNMSLNLNITLDVGVPEPTNATCIFDPDDGTGTVEDLTYDNSFFQRSHDYHTEGFFNATFNCSNNVSNHTYTFDIEVRKYVASDLSLVFHNYVPLNVSDTVVVYFHIDNGGFALIPYFVYLDLDYGDGSTSRRRRSPVLYDKTTYSHLYSERGNYTVTVFVEAQISNTTNTIAYSLRLGLMYFEYNTTVQFIDTTYVRYTMYGVKGTSNYTIDFNDTTADGQCSSSGFSSCDIHHLCPEYGYHLVQVVATNGSFIEVDNMNMTCDNPIVNITTDIPYTVAIPNGTIDAKLRIKEDDLYLPKLNCNWNMGDPIRRETYGPISQEVTYASPFLFNFQYIALGRHTITIDCWNLINDTRLETQITVTNKDFLFTGVFDRFYSQEDSPMYISSMLDTEIFSRLEIVASSAEKSHTNLWKLNVSVGETKPNRHGLLFTRGLVEEDKYYIILQVCFNEEPNNCIFEPTYAKFVMPPPHAEIVGSKRRYIKRGSVTIDAYSLSFDPVFPDVSNLTFGWSCISYDAADFDEAADKFASNANGSSCSYTEYSAGVLTLDTSANPTKSHYVVTVTVDNNRGMGATFTQILAVENYEPLTIKCKINCLAKVARSSKLQLIPNLSNNCPATFTWTLKKYSGSVYEDVNLASVASDAGIKSRSLTIENNTLEYGTWYLVSLRVILNGVTYGPAYYEFLTNRPPQGGFCQVVPFNETTLIPMEDKELENTTTSSSEYNLIAGIDVFNLTCQRWKDEGFTDNTFSSEEPLFYLYFLSYSGVDDNDNKRQLLYFDPGATSNLVSFQVGNANNDFKATVVLRITDVFGDYTDVRYNVKSKPPLTTADLAGLSNDAMLKKTSDYIDQFDEGLIKANRTYDYRTISRKVMDISSVYNELALNTSSGIILSPEDLLSLGYVRTEDETLLGWQDYWKIIVEVVDTKTTDYLIQVGEKHAYMLHACVFTWPPTKRMTLVAIETISLALNESTAVTDYSNVTAAILNAEVSNILARNLAHISDDRVFPHTEQLLAAALGVLDVIRNQLAILQTVLTPNLPQDPTVDEMRKYLEYISVFKTTEEVLNAPLSLQEQTFLAQKQLQKYYLQKYIKSEASKRALPDLTYALRNLTYVLGKMLVLGQEEIKLENDFVYISVEIKPAYSLVGQNIERPRVALELNELVEDNPEACNSSEITLRTVVFKENPYFWGQFADRITSYVPVFEIDGARLTSEKITYRLENEIEASCIDQDPTYEEDDPDKMIYILFDRQHAEDDFLIFVRPNTSDLIYELYFNKDEKPKISEDKYQYSTEMIKNDDTWTLEDGYKLRIRSSEYSETGKIWIALRPLLENSGDLSLLTRKFCANVTSVNCLAWRQKSGSEDYFWDKDVCEVSLSSTRSVTYCTCQNTNDTMTVGTTFYVPYNKVDFKTLDSLSDAIGRSPVIGMMIATVCVYIVLVIWAWREDLKDQYKWSYSLMIDNDIADSYFYIVRVFTGLRTGAGTGSKIGFVLVGEDGDTNIRIMDDDSHIGFERGSIRTFVMSTRKYLGELICLRIWHDDSGGNDSSWYLNKVNVTDLKNGMRYTFVCNQWFDYDSGDTRVDRVLNAQRYEEVRSYQDMIAYTIAEHHHWLSVALRPIRSNFTRVQRLSCLLGLVYLTMIICTMIVEIPDENTLINQAVIGPFRFSIENFKAALISVTVSSVIIIIVSIFFRNAEAAENSQNIDSAICKAYRKVNEKLKLDSSVLAKRYWPPAEEALEHDYFFLPHFCVYIGWTILAMAVFLATFLLVSFSADWELIKSEEWMTAVFVSFLTSVLLIEGVKIMIIILIYSLMCQRAYEPLEPYVDIDRLEEITKYNSATLTIGPQFNSVLYKPANPSKATLEKNKVKRIRNHQLLKIVSQLVVYSALLYMVYTISYESRDPRSFYLKNHVEQLFQFTSEVRDLESYTNWLKGTFINTYFSKTFFGANYEGNENKIYMEDLSNVRVGPARLRQLRIRQEDCIGPLGVNLTCHNKYEDEKKEMQNFCLGWKNQPCPVAEKSTYFSSAAWEFTSADEVWGFPTVAQYCTYGGGGYFMKLDVNRDVCEIIFDELVQFTWFDVQTRAVILEFTLYNANTNLFVYSKFAAEFPEFGGFLPYLDIQVFRLFLNTGSKGDFLLFLQFFFLLFVIAATFALAYQMFTDVKAFFKSVWNMLDIVALIMSYTTISIFIYKIFIIRKTIEVFENDKNEYVGFENLAFYDFITNTAYGVLVFLLSVRVSRILGYSGKINEMAAVISHAASDLYGFLLIFAITYFSYVICGTLLFGKEQEKYKDVFQTYGTLTEAIIGKNRVSNILTAKPGFAEFYYFTFVLFVLMTLATMAAAILNFSISMVRKEHQKLAPTNIIEVVFDRIGKLLNKFGPSKYEKTDKERRRRDSDTELNDILTDLRVFIHGFRSKKSKSSDKYRLTGDHEEDSK
ncbi:uncharacterized protein LOC123564401 isoform X2 [Mercenaria mercenaria]|uniref:uncharacterized protein LOC123564401 isoform X2 n=1 Tax=Mercenaria mercenaria TaxID=6596 RepID=UPI00234ED667|nr:uncharacterized protein LOC123564401 isoform X2 [Mercenaria mercenaria]